MAIAESREAPKQEYTFIMLCLSLVNYEHDQLLRARPASGQHQPPHYYSTLNLSHSVIVPSNLLYVLKVGAVPSGGEVFAIEAETFGGVVPAAPTHITPACSP